MTAWRKEEVDALKTNETGNVVIAHGSVQLCEETPIGLMEAAKDSCTGGRRTETC